MYLIIWVNQFFMADRQRRILKLEIANPLEEIGLIDYYRNTLLQCARISCIGCLYHAISSPLNALSSQYATFCEIVENHVYLLNFYQCMECGVNGQSVIVVMGHLATRVGSREPENVIIRLHIITEYPVEEMLEKNYRVSPIITQVRYKDLITCWSASKVT